MSRPERTDEEPEVYAVEMDTTRTRFSRRRFVELAAATTAAAVVLPSCGKGGPGTATTVPATSPPGKKSPEPSKSPKSPKPSKSPKQHTSPKPSKSPKSPKPSPSPAPSPKRGKVPPGKTGGQIKVGGKVYHLPCGAPIPPGAVCVCDCVTAPSCSCVGHVSCTCVGDTGCSCVSVSHYWHPN